MCYTHGKMVDTDEIYFTSEMLKKRRLLAELRAQLELHHGEIADSEMISFGLAEQEIKIEGMGVENKIIGDALRNSLVPAVWGSRIADAVRDVLIEVARNALTHGAGNSCSLKIEDSVIQLTDNGGDFNPWELGVKESGRGGAAAVRELLDTFGGRLVVAFERVKEQNLTTISLPQSIEDVKRVTRCCIDVTGQLRYTEEPCRVPSPAAVKVVQTCKVIYLLLPEYLSGSDVCKLDDIVDKPAFQGRKIVFVTSGASLMVEGLLADLFPGCQVLACDF